MYEEFDEDGVGTQAIPVWGNWCGPGHGGGTPIDILDSLSMAHDLCYVQLGYFNCTCDRSLVAGITASFSQMKAAEKRTENVIRAYFVIAPCRSQFI